MARTSAMRNDAGRGARGDGAAALVGSKGKHSLCERRGPVPTGPAPRVVPHRARVALLVGGALVAAILAMPMQALAQAGDAGHGKVVYERKCAPCHGVKGDGKGAAAELLDPKPRDFTSGIYKVRTSANKVPSDQDLFRLVTNGMPGTSMPGWAYCCKKRLTDSSLRSRMTSM